MRCYEDMELYVKPPEYEPPFGVHILPSVSRIDRNLHGHLFVCNNTDGCIMVEADQYMGRSTFATPM